VKVRSVNGDDVHPTNRRSRAVWLAATCVLATVAATAAMTGAGAQTAKARPVEARHTIALTSGRSAFRNALTVVAGDAQWGVYEQLGNTDATADFGSPATDRLYVRDAHGTSRRLPLTTVDQTLQDSGNWSLVDNMLTLSFGTARPVRWWDLAAGTHGDGGQPQGYVFGSSPDGWLLGSAGQIIDQPADGGASMVLGSPTGVATIDKATVTSVGDDGYAVAGTAGLLFSAWGATSTYVTLAVPANGTIFACGAEAYDAVACEVLKTPHNRVYILRLPTSGAAAVTTTAVGNAAAVSLAVSAHTTAWAVEPQAAWKLSTVSVHGGPATTSTYSLVDVSDTFAFGPLGALGSFLIATGTPRTRSAGLVKSAGVKPTPIDLGTPARVHVGATVLAPSRVVYADDRLSTGYLDIFQRPLSTRHSLTVGRAREVLRVKRGQLDILAASDSTIAVTSMSAGSADDVLRVLTSSRRTDVHIPFSAYVAVSGHDVLYRDDRSVKDLNARTGKTRTLPFHTDFSFVTLDRQVAYIRQPKGSTRLQVWAYPLRGGRTHELFSVPSRDELNTFSLVGGHHLVALEYTTGGNADDNDAGAIASARFRVVNRSHEQHDVAGPIPSRCSPVALTAKAIECNGRGKVVAVSLTANQSRTIFAPSDAAAGGVGQLFGLSVSGNRVAWETSAGAGRIGTLSAG
jgi:hypothetical protein